MNKRLIGMAPLSVLGTEPVDFIQAAAKVGYDFIGLRTRPVTTTEKDLNLLNGHPRMKEVLAALKDTGMKVVDTEFLAMDAHVDAGIWQPMLEAAAQLGAQSLTVTVTDPDWVRATETMGRLVEDAKKFNVVITLEPISYQTVKLLPEGVRMAQQTGCRVLLDTLHFHRAGGDMQHITDSLPYLANLVQLCDGLLAERADTREGLIEESRSHRGIPGEGDFKLAECLALLPSDMPVSIEVPNPKFDELGLEGYLHYLKIATENVLAQSDALR